MGVMRHVTKRTTGGLQDIVLQKGISWVRGGLVPISIFIFSFFRLPLTLLEAG